MPNLTPYFGLEYFLLGDLYSSSVDRARFVALDSYLAFIADVIGDGVIEGWNCKVSNNLILEIESGWGMINKKIVHTYGSYFRTLSDNTDYYVWMRNRVGVASDVSAFSDIKLYSHTQQDVLQQVSNFAVKSTTFNSVTLTWDAVVYDEPIFYEIYRSINNIDFSFVIKLSATEYRDTNLEENKIYYYRIRTTDNKIFSAYTNSLLALTPQNLQTPANVSNFAIRVSDTILHLSWEPSTSYHVLYNVISLVEVNILQQPVGVAQEILLPRQDNNTSINNLQNDKLYKIEIYTQSFANRKSSSIVQYVTPISDNGPDDIISVTVTDFKATDSYANVLNITWNTYDDPYESFSGRAEIILEEVVGERTITSERILMNDSMGTTNVQIFSFLDGTKRQYKRVEARTTYYITVRNVASGGRKSVGKRIKYQTRNFAPPLSPTDIVVERVISDQNLGTVSNDLKITWNNPNTNPNVRNILTVVRKLNNQNTFIFNEIDSQNRKVNGRYQYFIPAENVIKGSIFDISIKCVDEFKNESSTTTFSYLYDPQIAVDRPSEPSFKAVSGNKSVTLTWTLAPEELIHKVNIYRANYGQNQGIESGFALIATVDAYLNTFTDYDTQNDVIYSYFVSAVNSAGFESVNIMNTAGVAQIFIRARPTNNTKFLTPTNLNISKIGNNLELTWDATGGVFDGYEIYRSVNNKYSFQLIGHVSASSTYFLDTNVLNRQKNVYYMIRKFRNEAESYVVVGPTLVNDAVLLANIKIENGEALVDQSVSRLLKNLEDPIRVETFEQLLTHKHDFTLQDKRIDLSPRIEITNWITRDNQTFVTNTDLSNITEYNLFIGGLDIRETTLLYSLNKTANSITFERKLCAIGNELEEQTFPYASLPSLSLLVDNIQEVQGQLEQAQIIAVSATQINTGILDKSQITNINHRGRMNEKLIPQQESMTTVDDGYRFIFQDRVQNFGSATVFYDLISIGNTDILVAATSAGVLLSKNFGQTWEINTQFTTPASKIIFAPKYNTLFAATNSGVYATGVNENTTFQAWSEVFGTENTKIVRDFTIDAEGDVYCTSDLGVYKLQRVVNSSNFYFQQLPILGPLSTDAYAIIFDRKSQRLLVSTQFGTFESYDGGEFWFFTNELTEQDPIFAFYEYQDFIYGITNTSIYRKSPNENLFYKIADFEDVEIARKVLIYNNRLYVLTNRGVIISNAADNIYYDLTIRFNLGFIDIKILNKKLPIHTINVLGTVLLLGAESRLYISRDGKNGGIQYQEENVVCPTVYINGSEQTIGYRYSNSNNVYNKFLCFDVKIEVDDIVTVANQYQIFEAQYGGWVNCNYLAPLTLKLGNRTVAKIAVAEKPAVYFANITYPNITDRNANLFTYEQYKLAFTEQLSILLEEEINENDEFVNFKNFTNENVKKSYNIFESMRSQIYENARFVTITNAANEQIRTSFEFPSMNILLLSDPTDANQNQVKNIIGTYGTYAAQSSSLSATGNGSFSTELATDGVDAKYLQDVAAYNDFQDKRLNRVARKYPTPHIGWRGFQSAYCAGVREIFPFDYADFDVVAIINSVDGVFKLKNPISKYHQLTCDIENVTLENTSLPHYVIEDSFELLNSGLPSHLSQIHHVNIINAGCIQEKLMGNQMNNFATPLNAKYILPVDSNFYDKKASTIDNQELFVHKNMNSLTPYVKSYVYVEENNTLIVGSINGCLMLNLDSYESVKMLFDEEIDPNVVDLQIINENIHALTSKYIYKLNVSDNKFYKESYGNLPLQPKCFGITNNKNIIVGADDGIYISRNGIKKFTKIFDSESIDFLFITDYAYALDANQKIYISRNDGPWNLLFSNSNNIIINKIIKHRGNNVFATNRGLYNDNTSISGQNLSLQLFDIFRNTTLSSSVIVNDVYSADNKIYACLSDGRFVIYDGSFTVYVTIFDVIHKIFVIDNKIYLFSFDKFIVFGENMIRKVSSGYKL